MGLLDRIGHLPPAVLRGLLNTVDGDAHTTLSSGFRAGMAGLPQSAPSPSSGQVMELQANGSLAAPQRPNAGLLAGQRPNGGLLSANTAQGPTKKERDPNAYTFGDYLLGALATGNPFAPAAMALDQRQRRKAETRNRAGAEALFAELGLNGQPQAARRPAMQGPGIDGAPVSQPGAGLPPPGPAPLSRSKVLAALARVRANGFDATPFMPQIEALMEQQETDAFLSAVPEPERAYARFDPKGYAGVAFDRLKPRSGENDTVQMNPATGRYERVYEARTKLDDEWMVDPKNPEARIPRPGSKADPKYIRETSFNRADGQRDAAPPMWSVYGPSSGRPGEINSTGDVMGPIYSKIARGQTLTPGEQRLYEDGRRAADPLAALLGSLPNAQPAPRPATPPRLPPPKPGAQRNGSVAQQGGVYRPTSAADMAAIPKGAKFVNPADGRVLTKAR